MKISKPFLLFFLFAFIYNLEPGLKAGEKQAIEIKMGSTVTYDKERNYFKFSYSGSNDSYLIIYSNNGIRESTLIEPNGNKTLLDFYHRYYKKLEYKGDYYLDLKCHSVLCDFGDDFNIAIFGDYLEDLDLNKNFYFLEFNLNNNYKQYFGSRKYKVSNLKEDKTIYFQNLMEPSKNYYPYDPENPSNPDSNNLTNFEVYDINTKTTSKNLKIFTFKANHEYIITILCFKYNGQYSANDFYYPDFILFSIKKSNIKIITGEEESLASDGVFLGFVNANNAKEFHLYIENIDNRDNRIYYAKTNEVIDNNLDIFSKLNFINDNSLIISKGEQQNTIFYVIPFNFETKVELYIVDEIINECRNSYFIPAKTTKIILCNVEEKREGKSVSYNYVLTYKSQYKNMRIPFFGEKEGTDYIIQNTLALPIYIAKSDKDCTITTSRYSPKYAYFGAENSYSFNSLFNFFLKSFKDANHIHINLNDYVKLTQMNLRVSSKYIPFFEFYNAYINNSGLNFNIYIRQIFGGSEAYECNADDFNQKNLDFLTTPISNSKCKNKKSLINNLWTLAGTKIYSGFLTQNSYFDIYAEVKNDTNKIINLQSLMKNELYYNNNAKYLKKDVEYIINFELNHLIKLEPGFNAEVDIKKDQSIKKLNSQNPTAEITGSGYTIKSNNDAMVYFFGKLPQQYKQLEISKEKSAGKIIKIHNYSKNLTIDFGFEHYSPSNYPAEFNLRDNRIFYLDNLYEKLKVNLVTNEKLFIYGPVAEIDKLSIEYIGKNLNNANNDFNIFLVPANNEDNTLIIDVDYINTIYTDIFFCHEDTIVKLSLDNNKNEEDIIYTNSNFTDRIRFFKLFRAGDSKLTFKTNKEFVFTYSFVDIIDKRVFIDNPEYLNERTILSELIINEISKTDNNNIIKIKFNPNYKRSTTRYIILIAQKKDQNNLDNFNNPCFIAELLNKKPQGLLTDVIYDAGESNSIYAEVDISNILFDDNKYLINIISQELRFDKKINFYEPKEFSYSSEEGSSSKVEGFTLAFAIVVPILAVIIIILIILLFRSRRKGSYSEDIEKLAPLGQIN